MSNKKEIKNLKKEFDDLKQKVICGIKTGHQFRLIGIFEYGDVFGKFQCFSCNITKTRKLSKSEINSAKKLGFKISIKKSDI